MDHSIVGMIKDSDLEAPRFPRIEVNPDPRLEKRIEEMERRLAALESEQIMRRASGQREVVSAADDSWCLDRSGAFTNHHQNRCRDA